MNEEDIIVKEYDDQATKLVRDINDAMKSLESDTTQNGQLCHEDLGNLLKEVSKQLQNVQMVRSTQPPKNWIYANPLYQFQNRFDDLRKMMNGNIEEPTFNMWNIIKKHQSFVITLILLLIFVWLYTRWPDQPINQTIEQNIPMPTSFKI